jgi:hypothetical protein
MQVHKRSSPDAGRFASPAFQRDSSTEKHEIDAGGRRGGVKPPPGRMEQTSCSQRGQFDDRDGDSDGQYD